MDVAYFHTFLYSLILQSKTYQINVERLLNMVISVVKISNCMFFNNGPCKFIRIPHIRYNRFYTRTNMLFTAIISFHTEA